jgi:hypothetical protein
MSSGRGLRTITRSLLEALHHQRRGRGQHLGTTLGERPGNFRDVRREHLLHGASGERTRAREKLLGDAPERVDVGAAAGREVES